MKDFKEILAATREALAVADRRRGALAARIGEVAHGALLASRAAEIPLAGGGALEFRAVRGRVSPWSDGSRAITATAGGVLVWRSPTELRLIEEQSMSRIIDGNMHWDVGPVRDAGSGLVLRPATVAQLRAIARDLPAAVAAVLSAAASSAAAESADAAAALDALVG